MNDTYKPGNVAMVAGASDSDGVRAIWQGNQWATSTGRYLNHWQVTVRPLVVIDPEDREAVERFTHLFLSHHWGPDHETHTDAGQAALREFADPKPPKPDEPMGTFSRVLDVEGNVWCRMPEGGWKRDNGNFVAHYDLIEGVVEVLS